MKIKSIICPAFYILLLIACCACSAKPIDRAKITEFNEIEVYDSFYAHENIFYDMDKDFDLAIDNFIAVYDTEKNIVGFSVTVLMYPKYEKTIKDYGIFIVVDENLRDLIQTSHIAPTFTDAAIEIDDDYLYLNYEPYVTSLGMLTGSMFYSIPLDELSKEDVIQKVKEGLYFRVLKNKKLGPLEKVIYNGEISYHEKALDPGGSPEPLYEIIRMLLHQSLEQL